MTREDWEHNLSFFLPEDELVITGGEPTLHKDLEYIIDSWVDKFNKPVLRVTSNGYNWRRWLPVQDKVAVFNFSHYPGKNDADIDQLNTSSISIKNIGKMTAKDFWDVWLAPARLNISNKSLNLINDKCGLNETKAVCKKYVWPCCVGGFFYRRIKGLPRFYGGIEIGSPNWRKQLENKSPCSTICRHCFVLPRTELELGEYIPISKRELTGIRLKNIDTGRILLNAISCHKEGKLSDATEGYQKILRNDPDNPNALHLLGLIESSEKKSAIAISLLKKSLELVPQNAQWLLNYGNILQEAMKDAKYAAEPIDPELPLSLYKKALSIDPELFAAKVAVSNYYINCGELENALETYFDLMCEHPENKDIVIRYITIKKAMEDEKSNNVKNQNQNVSSTMMDIGDTFLKAFSYHKNKQHDKAKAGYREVLQLNPGHPNALHMLGLIESANKNYDIALPMLAQSIELIPDSLSWLLNYAKILFDTENFSSAIEIYQKALSLEPQTHKAKEAIADIYCLQKNYKEALSIYHNMLCGCGNNLNLIIKFIETQKKLAETEGRDNFLNLCAEQNVKKIYHLDSK